MSSKADKAKLAKGAKEIDEAKKQAEQEKPLVIPKATRPLQDVLKDRVTILPGHVGLKLDDKTEVQESFQILDWVTSFHHHAGFMIGDLINFGHAKFGKNRYQQALLKTGRAYDTLAKYSSVAGRIPPEQRQAALGFEHHRVILMLGDDHQQVQKVLKEVGDQADKGHAPSVKDLRIKVQKLTPRKKKEPKRAPTSGKSKKRQPKPEPPPYEPTPDEQSKMDEAETKAMELSDSIRSGDVFKLVAKCDNGEKSRWLKIFEPFVTFYNTLERVTGYS